jgi:hypothetical protein
VLVLPLGREPGDHRRRQPRRAPQEPFERRDEVPARHPVQIQQRQRLGHLRGLAAPRRNDRTLELPTLTRLGIDPSVVDPGRADVDPACARRDRARTRVPVADHQPVAVLVDLIGQCLDVRVGFGLQRGGGASDARLPGRSRPGSRPAPCAWSPQLLPSTSAFLPRRHCCAGCSCWSSRKARRALQQAGDPQLPVITLIPPARPRGRQSDPPRVTVDDGCIV